MIEELVRYSEWLKKDFEELYDDVFVSEGLHILITIKDNIYKYESLFYEKDKKLDNNEKTIFNILLAIEPQSRGLGNNKDIYDKVIFSNNPYAIFFKLFFSNKVSSVKKSFSEFKVRENENNYEIVKEKFKSEFLKNSIEKYFSEDGEVIKFYNKIEKDFLNNASEDEIIVINNIKGYISSLKDKILNDDKLFNMFIQKEENRIIYKDKFFDEFIKINFIVGDVKNHYENYLSKAIERYMRKRIFAKSTYTITDYGLSNFFNKVAKEKKVFNLHRTAFYDVNKKIIYKAAVELKEFLYVSDKLPKPLPIFIDRDELNKKVITLFRSGKKDSYKKVISSLIKDYREDLGNYYLLYFSKNEINDFDLEDILDEFLDNKLKSNYFSSGKLKGNKDIVNGIYKYRKSLYDAFYKGRIYLITARMVKDICLPSIYYEILKNEKGYSYRKAKKLLLYYFLLNDIFDKEYKNTGGRKMSSKLKEYYEGLEKLLNNDSDGFENDGQFAFGLGQAIYYLLSQSESHNKNHAMIMPFLQKLNNYSLFMEQLKSVFRSYSYKISMNNNKFNKLMSYITGYELENENDFKNLETIILCGYFAKSLLYKKDENNNSNDGEVTNNE